MTTTLRPAGPDTSDEPPNGTPYAIHARGRQVGGLTLVDTPGSMADAWITRLTVEPSHRRRGHGSAAVLAAEELLRARGHGRAGLRFATVDHHGPAFAAALGYTERSHNMVKALAPPTGTAPGPAVTLRDLTEAELPDWLAEERTSAAVLRSDDRAGPGEAENRAGASLRALLPDGLATAGTTVRVAERDGAVAGTLWLRTGPGTPDGTGGWVYSVRVAPAHRRAGVGGALMAEAERICRAVGAATLGLHVLADNTGARALYRSLGYRTTQENWVKNL